MADAPPHRKPLRLTTRLGNRQAEVRGDLGGNLQGSVLDSRNLDGPIGSLLRKNVPETDNSIAPRIECWPVQLERNALKNYQNSDDPRVVSNTHYMHRPP